MSKENIPSEEQVADLEAAYAAAGYLAINDGPGIADLADHAGSAEFGIVEDIEETDMRNGE